MRSKSDTPLEEIDCSPAQQSMRQPTWGDGKAVVAYDFETTENGNPFMLSISSPVEEKTLHADGDELVAGHVWQELTQQKYAGNVINVWYNMSFDVEVLLKQVLSKEKMKELQVHNQTVFDTGTKKYELKYIKGKFFEITDLHGHTWQHYDIANITQAGSLESSAQEWLGEGKLDDVDVDEFSNAEFRENNINQIREYCERDAKITRRLTEKIIEVAESINIPMGRPISTGYVAAEYMRANMENKPGWVGQKVQNLAWQSYHGGRFEVFRKGYVNQPVAGPDINSAYPAVMSELPNPSELSWKYDGENPGLDEIRKADMGFLTVTVSTNANKKIQPFAAKDSGTVIFPVLENETITVLKDTFVFALENGYIVDYTIEDFALGFDFNEASKPFGFLKDMYEQRKIWENDADKPLRAQMLKIVINSMYGKTAQTTIIEQEPAADAELNENDNVSVKLGLVAEQEHVSGRMFNPVVASYTTGLTRLKLHKTIEKHGLVENTIMFATDSVMVEREAYENTEFIEQEIPDESDSYKEALGKWDYDYQAKDAFILGAGVYEVTRTDLEPDWFDTYHALRQAVVKQATRGFKEARIESIRKAAERFSEQNKIPIKQMRPVTIGEALYFHKHLSLFDVAQFKENERHIAPDMDTKRVWPEASNHLKNLVNNSYRGEPVCLE